MELLDYLKYAAEAGASDLFIVAGGPVCVKLEKRMTPVGGERVFPQETEKLIMALYELAKRSPERYLSRGDDDFSFSVPDWPGSGSTPTAREGPWRRWCGLWPLISPTGRACPSRPR